MQANNAQTQEKATSGVNRELRTFIGRRKMRQRINETDNCAYSMRIVFKNAQGASLIEETSTESMRELACHFAFSSADQKAMTLTLAWEGNGAVAGRN